jgi:hypothetical protein
MPATTQGPLDIGLRRRQAGPPMTGPAHLGCVAELLGPDADVVQRRVGGLTTGGGRPVGGAGK